MTAQHIKPFLLRSLYFPVIVECFLLLSFLNTSTRGNATIMESRNTTSISIHINHCLSFEEGDLKSNTFYSPNYPNNTNCVRLIEAEPDKVVRLEFLDVFELSCLYDYLEVRDGKYEYSQLIAKLCGNKIPPLIISSGRHLWLRFKSEYNVQHRHFKAVYSFVNKTAIRGRREVPDLEKEEEGRKEDCLAFEEGDPELQMFFSPRFPDDYPGSITCERIIEAEPDKMIRIDFLDVFEIEPATTGPNCSYDFLEIRDGKFGYSQLIGRFCGRNKFPSQIISSGRYLWLGFKSDENIQYKGFKAAYSFIDKPSSVTTPELERCYKEVSGREGFIVKGDIDSDLVKKHVALNIPLDCMWKVTAEENNKVQLYFETFELGKPNECDSNYIEIYPEKTDEPSRLNSFCGSIAEERISSKTSVLHVRFMADSRAYNKTNFKILYTSFRESKDAPCREDEFDCQDATCISLLLKCNKNVNCRYLWDESEDECAVVETAIEKIIKDKRKIVILIIFFFFLTGMCFSFIYNCTRKLVRDHKIIQENKRKSRESRLDQIGLKSQSAPQLAQVASHKTLSRHQSIDSSDRSTSPGLHMVAGLHQNSLPSSHYTPKPVDLIPILTESKGCGTEDTLSHDDIPTNGDAVFIQGLNEFSNDEPFGDDIYGRPMPEMRDSECQTRESLFQNISYTPNSSGDCSLTPPPLPPVSQITRSNKSSSGIRTLPSVNSRSTKSPGTFTTFGYNKNNQKPTSKPSYRAEAVIEMDKSRDKSSSHDTRPFSVQSTKSAPDVIFTH